MSGSVVLTALLLFPSQQPRIARRISREAGPFHLRARAHLLRTVRDGPERQSGLQIRLINKRPLMKIELTHLPLALEKGQVD